MDFDKMCFECYKFELIYETDDYYVCRCLMCGSVFKRWKK